MIPWIILASPFAYSVFADCMTGPRAYNRFPAFASTTTWRLDDDVVELVTFRMLHDGNVLIQLSGVGTPQSWDGFVYFLHRDCIAHDVDADNDIDLRDWAALSVGILYCDGKNCWRRAG